MSLYSIALLAFDSKSLQKSLQKSGRAFSSLSELNSTFLCRFPLFEDGAPSYVGLLAIYKQWLLSLPKDIRDGLTTTNDGRKCQLPLIPDKKITRIPEEKSRLGKVISCFDEQLKKRRLSDEIELRAFQSPFEETEAYVIDLIIVAKKTGTNLVFIDDPDRSKSKIFWGAGEELNEQVGSRQLMLKEHLFKHFFPKTPLLRIRLDPENPEFANQINEILEKHVYHFRKKF